MCKHWKRNYFAIIQRSYSAQVEDYYYYFFIFKIKYSRAGHVHIVYFKKHELQSDYKFVTILKYLYVLCEWVERKSRIGDVN